MPRRQWEDDNPELPLSAARMKGMEDDIEAAAGVPAEALVGRLQGGPARDLLDTLYRDGVAKGNAGARYSIIAGALRNTGAGFVLIDDAAHTPINVSSVTTAADNMTITVSYNFTATEVGTTILVPDETLAVAGYTFGASVGLNSFGVQAAQPGGFGDYLSWNGSAWASLNGFITSASMDPSTGLVTCNHAALGGPVAGTVSSRSLTKRASVEGMGASTTQFYLVDNAGVTVKTPTSDSRVWIQRTGARRVPFTELVQANSNIWFYGLHRVN
ncbi:minor tail protein [Arthrobacter phage Shambre1]|uniref:Minor tail protein n=1 Tax=Arthrobacter phage Shambre1 TaxID=2927284 RepID=A0A977KNK4_9CAUD|nr:minor tail protein [Arthrobacter phage Shambre1]UXE04757.1 minor tail protein [Arthrobacter phage Shambre1]